MFAGMLEDARRLASYLDNYSLYFRLHAFVIIGVLGFLAHRIPLIPLGDET
jgi:hypothetical protein